MKKAVAVILSMILLTAGFSCAASAEGTKFVTIGEWLDAKGECGDCMVLVRIRTILNPVLAVAEDETGTVNLFSANGEDSLIVNFMGDEGVTEGCVMVIANPRWNEYEGTIEMADWALLRVLPAVGQGGEP